MCKPKRQRRAFAQNDFAHEWRGRDWTDFTVASGGSLNRQSRRPTIDNEDTISEIGQRSSYWKPEIERDEIIWSTFRS